MANTLRFACLILVCAALSAQAQSYEEIKNQYDNIMDVRITGRVSRM